MDVIGDPANNPEPVEIKLFGDDIHLLQQKADEVAVTTRNPERDLGSTIAEIQARLKNEVSLPKGVTMEFGEFAVPVSVFIVTTMALLGVFFALWFTGVTFNISSFVGVIMIIGIVAENAIFIQAGWIRADLNNLENVTACCNSLECRTLQDLTGPYRILARGGFLTKDSPYSG